MQDPKLQQFQTKVRRSASLPSRARRPPRSLRTNTDPRTQASSASDMLRGRKRIVGGQTSPTGIEGGADGTFRLLMSMRSGSFSRITTSFPANSGPPRTVENAERTAASPITMGPGGEANALPLTRTISDTSCANPRKGYLHSASLPEIGVLKVRTKGSLLLESWHRSSSTGDSLADRPFAEDSENANHGSNNNQGHKTGSESVLSAPNITPIHLASSPYPFRKSRKNCSSSSLVNGSLERQGSPLLSSETKNTEDKTRRGSDVEPCKGNDTSPSALSSDEMARRLFFLEGYKSKDISPMLYKK